MLNCKSFYHYNSSHYGNKLYIWFLQHFIGVFIHILFHCLFADKNKPRFTFFFVKKSVFLCEGICHLTSEMQFTVRMITTTRKIKKKKRVLESWKWSCTIYLSIIIIYATACNSQMLSKSKNMWIMFRGGSRNVCACFFFFFHFTIRCEYWSHISYKGNSIWFILTEKRSRQLETSRWKNCRWNFTFGFSVCVGVLEVVVFFPSVYHLASSFAASIYSP